MPIKSDAQRRAVAKYNTANYDQIQIRVAKGKRAAIQKRAEELCKSVNGYIEDLIDDDLGKEGTK